MKKEKVLVLGLAACISLTSISFVYADNGNKNGKKEKVKVETLAKVPEEKQVSVSKEIVSYDEKNINVDMKIPVINGMNDVKNQSQINNDIKLDAMKLKDEFEKEAKELISSYEKGTKIPKMEFTYDFQVENSHDILSIFVKTYKYQGGANGENGINIYNIDLKSNKIIRLYDLFKANSNYKEIINEEIKKQIAEREKKGNIFFNGEEEFKTISDTQYFYIKGDNLVIVFPQYEIGPRPLGTVEFEIPLYMINHTLKDAIPLVVKDAYYNEKYDFKFKIAPIWKEKTYIVESYDTNNFKVVVDFIYDAIDRNAEDNKLMSILVMNKKDYYDLTKDKREEVGYLIAETEAYAYLIKTYEPNPYKTGTADYEEYKKLAAVIDGVDDLFDLVVVKNEINPQVKDYKLVMINGKKENLNKEMFKTEKGNLMIPVAKVAKALGYKVKWNPQNKTVTLNEGKISIISIDKNTYGYAKSLITLEEPAVLKQGTTFVPINYFDEVLKLSVSVNEDGMFCINSK